MRRIDTDLRKTIQMWIILLCVCAVSCIAAHDNTNTVSKYKRTTGSKLVTMIVHEQCLALTQVCISKRDVRICEGVYVQRKVSGLKTLQNQSSVTINRVTATNRLSKSDAFHVRELIKCTSLHVVHSLQHRRDAETDLANAISHFKNLTEVSHLNVRFCEYIRRMASAAACGSVLGRANKTKIAEGRFRIADRYRLRITMSHYGTPELANSLYNFCLCYGKFVATPEERRKSLANKLKELYSRIKEDT